MSEHGVPEGWKPKRSATGGLIAECWITPGGYTVARHGRALLPVAVFRPKDEYPFAYVPTIAEVPELILVDLKALMTPAFRAAFTAVQAKKSEVAKC